MTPAEQDVAKVRRRLASLIVDRRSGHLAAANCVLETLYALFEPDSPWRLESGADHLVLSKGHAAPALYLVLEHHGLVPAVTSETLRRGRTPFEGHPRRGAFPGSLVTTGSLGHGCAFAVGRALADPTSNLAVIVSDGELQEGLAFEALRFAGVVRPTNLHLIVDCNGHQTSGPTSVVGGEPDALIGALSGSFDVAQVGAHDLAQLRCRLSNTYCKGPSITLCRSERDHGMPYHWTEELYGESIPEQIRERVLAWTNEA